MCESYNMDIITTQIFLPYLPVQSLLILASTGPPTTVSLNHSIACIHKIERWYDTLLHYKARNDEPHLETVVEKLAAVSGNILYSYTHTFCGQVVPSTGNTLSSMQ